jgi:hypothetical protein
MFSCLHIGLTLYLKVNLKVQVYLINEPVCAGKLLPKGQFLTLFTLTVFETMA